LFIVSYNVLHCYAASFWQPFIEMVGKQSSNL
jgi:hypothetical protein